MNQKNICTNDFESNFLIKDDAEEKNYKCFYQIPPKNARYIVMKIETTGLEKDDHILAIGITEIRNCNIRESYSIYIPPRLILKPKNISIHGITNEYYFEYLQDVYMDPKKQLLFFIKWLDDSIIFSHNAYFCYKFLNRELSHWGIEEIPLEKFRCTERIFREVIRVISPNYNRKETSLIKCCRYFNIDVNENKLHKVPDGSMIIAKLVIALYNTIDMNPIILNFFDYNDQRSIDSHYNNYYKNIK